MISLAYQWQDAIGTGGRRSIDEAVYDGFIDQGRPNMT